MNKLALYLRGLLKRHVGITAVLLLSLLVPEARANTTVVTTQPGSYTFACNPYTAASYDLQTAPFLSGVQVGDVILTWDPAEQYWTSFIYMGAGFGTIMGYPSDWILGDLSPNATLPSYAVADVLDGVYWLDPTASGAPSLTPGVGFFYVNENGAPVTLTFTGSPASGPTPPCGSINPLGSTSTSGADYQAVTGLSPVDGSLFELWTGRDWYIFTYVCGGWQAAPDVPVGIQPVINLGQAAMVYTPCSAPSGLTLSVIGPAVTAPGMQLEYTVNVVNYGSTPTAAGTLRLSLGVSSSSGGEPALLPPLGYLISDNATYFTINVPSLAGCSSTVFSFFIGSGTLQTGDSILMSASLDSSTSTPLTVNCVSSLDPNSKTGPAGIGAHHYLTGNPALPYTITFENEPTASAPAQRVIITDQLNPATMQLGSFQFGPIAFGNQQIVPPAGENPFHYTVQSYNVGGNTINVQISATNDDNTLSPTYGKVTWAFQAIDPNTGLPPASPLIGFLPPNTAPPAGQGIVTLTVNSLPSLATGDLITNFASVVFDANSPIATQTWTNTVITTLPTLTISKAPAKQVKITWTGWTLQEAGSLAGPWTDSAVQVSPWTFTPLGSQKFYRLAAP